MEEFKTFKRWHAILFGIILVTAAVLYYRAQHWPDAMIVLNDRTIKVLVADTYTRQFQGWSDRDSMGEYQGMLFPFGLNGRPTIVMRNMRFPLDIVWLDKGKVVHIVKDAKPEPTRKESDLTRYSPPVSANTVLELPAGFTTTINLQIGDMLTLL